MKTLLIRVSDANSGQQISSIFQNQNQSFAKISQLLHSVLEEIILHF